MSQNQDIKALAKRAMELSHLPEAKQAGRDVEARSVVSAIIRATPNHVIEAAGKEMEKRWGPQIKTSLKDWTDWIEFLTKLTHPWWYLKMSDGKPPVIATLAAAALTNQTRRPADVLASFAAVKEDEREAVTEQVRAFLGDVLRATTTPVRDEFIALMRSRPELKWPHDPWACVLPLDGGAPPIRNVVDNPGEDHDGGWYDDPSNNTTWENLKFGWADAIKRWDGEILLTNPAAQFYLFVKETADNTVKAASTLLDWAKYLPYVPVVVVGAVGLAATWKGLSWLSRLAPRPPRIADDYSKVYAPPRKEARRYHG
jgi:hypothetical protein